MKTKPDAYTLEWNGKESNIVKWESCGFKAVFCQWKDVSRENNDIMLCPSCKCNVDKVKDGKSPKMRGK